MYHLRRLVVTCYSANSSYILSIVIELVIVLNHKSFPFVAILHLKYYEL